MTPLAQALDRLIAAATDKDRRGWTVLLILVAFVAVWALYGTIAKSSQDMHRDMSELIAWSRDLALGFSKHPPLSATVVRLWFAVLPITDGTFYLLGMVIAGVSLWIAWILYGDYLPPAKRLIGVALLTFIPFFDFHALKVNVNTMLLPSWAATTLWFLRSYRTQSSGYAALAGLGAALCMMTKYWSVFLFIGLGAAALLDQRRGDYFKSKAPYITALIAIAGFSPHVVWLLQNNFPTFDYAMESHAYNSVAASLWAGVSYLAAVAAYGSVPAIVAFIAARPNLATIRDMAWPADADRRMAAVTFWLTLIVPIIPAPFLGVEVNGLWSMSGWTLFPVLLLGPQSIEISAPAARRILGAAIALPLIMLLLSPVIALMIHKGDLKPQSTQIHQLSEAVNKAWRTSARAPLFFVGGDTDLADGVAAYAPDRPHVLPGLPQRRHELLAEKGMALVCFASDAGCVNTIRAAASADARSAISEANLSRRFFGIDGPSERYLIVVIPPRTTTP